MRTSKKYTSRMIWSKSITPSWNRQPPTMVILTPIKDNRAIFVQNLGLPNPVAKLLRSPPLEGQARGRTNSSTPNIKGDGYDNGKLNNKLTSSDEDKYVDAFEAWLSNEAMIEEVIAYSKDEMADMLTGIDLLVDKEKKANSSSEEERILCAREIKMGLHIKATSRGLRKETSSLGSSFHMVFDLQNTPSRNKAKRVKHLGPSAPVNFSKQPIKAYLSHTPGMAAYLARKDPCSSPSMDKYKGHMAKQQTIREL